MEIKITQGLDKARKAAEIRTEVFINEQRKSHFQPRQMRQASIKSWATLLSAKNILMNSAHTSL